MIELIQYIYESSTGNAYLYSLDLEHPFYDITDKIEAIEKTEYVQTVTKITGGDEDFEEFASNTFDEWSNRGHKSFEVPFRFNSKGQCKLARIYKSVLGGDSKTIGGVKIKLGNGSIYKNIRVRTGDQEYATCLVWNAMVDAVQDDKGAFNIDDFDQVCALVDTIAASFSKNWVQSFQKQCQALAKFLDSAKFPNQSSSEKGRYLKYHAIRYGEVVKDENDNQVESVGTLYKAFVDKYVSACEKEIGTPKDNYDPSDIILYTDEAASILQSLISADVTNPNDLNKMYREQLFNPGICVGVSLKKLGGSGRVQFFNIGGGSQTATISTMQLVGNNDNSTKVECEGKFKFNGVSDISEDPEDGDTISEGTLILEVRSFGDYIGMDVKEKRGPSLGKVSVRIWKKALNCQSTKRKDLSKACIALKEIVKNNDKQTVQDLIQHGVKSGPWCLPFVLIH